MTYALENVLRVIMLDITPFLVYITSQLRDLRWHPHLLNSKLLLFDRDTGLNVLLEGDEED